MSIAPQTHERMSRNYEDAYVKAIEEKYSIKVTQKHSHESAMGGAMAKIKSWKLESHQSPTKLSAGESYPPNGTHFTYDKARQKALISGQKSRNIKSVGKTVKPIKRQTRKRKLIGDVDEGTRPKRSRKNSSHKTPTRLKNKPTVNSLHKSSQKYSNKSSLSSSDRNNQNFSDNINLISLDTKTVHNVEGAALAHFVDAREIIVAKRAGRLENKKVAGKNLFQYEEDKGGKQGRKKLKVNKLQHVNALKHMQLNALRNKSCPNVKVHDSPPEIDCSPIKMIDQNLNHITDSVTRENLAELWNKKIQEVSESSPVKGKMSAFEISLLKGKQNLERRKSIESAALRSSPRANANVPKPNYCDRKQQRKSTLSLLPALDCDSETAGKKLEEIAKKGRKRRKTVASVNTLSPCSVEYKIIKPIPKRRSANNRKARKSATSISDMEIDKSIKYRMNGSPKLNNLPTRLSLDSLSGTTDQHQGSAFTSLHKQISGSPPALYSPSFIITNDRSPPFSNKTLQRPNTLPVEKFMSPMKTENASALCYTKATETAKSKNETLSNTRSSKSLEDTVNMLRRNTSARSKEVAHSGNFTVSPARSDSLASRRSSRSSTPNITPIKSEILTPNSTPCSSPSKSPCTTPVCRSSKISKLGKKKKKCLFLRHDEVLTRWHDGLYYLGKILKIDEAHRKCLLSYEDHSEHWSLFKDIHRVLKEEEMVCCVCLSDVSEPPNEIVLCEYCLQGYHQHCHSPSIGSGTIVDPDEPWYCRKCVFFVRASRGNEEIDQKWDDEMRKMKVVLPYGLETLHWDLHHKNNTEQSYCYCGGPGIWFQKMLQCCRCKQWFHEACMQCREFPLMYADSFYIFVCSPCNLGNEYIKRLDVDWPDLIHIGLFNLAVMQKRKYFDLDNELMPWITQNWDQLQVSKYNDMTEDEKLIEVSNALECSKTRFIKGSEIRRKQELWGLRVRVPPPRIHITLPFSGHITDEVMNKLKIKGRRSKVFMPVECKSPVNLIQQSPQRSTKMVENKFDPAVLEKGVRRSSPSKQSGSPAKSARKPKQKLKFLDSLVPPDTSFTAHNHPFKNEFEQNAENAELNIRAKIWTKFLTLYDGNDDMQSNVGGSSCVSDDPPILEKVEPVVPTNASNGTPPMPEIQEKKNGRKSVPTLEKSDEQRSSDRRTRRKSVVRISAPAGFIVDSEKEDDFTVKHIKSVAGGNYFCCRDKIGYGRGFSVMGKREDSEGHVEYMVKWD